MLLLREADRRLEVSFGAASADALSERLTSKDAVPVRAGYLCHQKSLLLGCIY